MLLGNAVDWWTVHVAGLGTPTRLRDACHGCSIGIPMLLSSTSKMLQLPSLHSYALCEAAKLTRLMLLGNAVDWWTVHVAGLGTPTRLRDACHGCSHGCAHPSRPLAEDRHDPAGGLRQMWPQRQPCCWASDSQQGPDRLHQPCAIRVLETASSLHGVGAQPARAPHHHLPRTTCGPHETLQPHAQHSTCIQPFSSPGLHPLPDP